MHLGSRPRRLDRRGAEQREVGLERRAHAVAVPLDVLVERVGVDPELIAARAQIGDLVREPTPLALGDATRRGLGFAHHCLRASLRLFGELTRVCLRLAHRLVGHALSEQQRALQHLGVLATGRQSVGADRATALGLLQLLREVFDGGGSAFEQVVDFVAIEATPSFLDLATTELLRGDIHAEQGSEGSRAIGVPRSPDSPVGLSRRGASASAAADESSQQEDREEHHDERRVEHPHGRDDPPNRAQDRFGEVDQQPRERREERALLGREPRDDRTAGHDDHVDGEEPVDDGHGQAW